ncbi:MAG: ParA family protein, partial [Mycobacterium sp.]|nr:ParA family protein [Mycobacterium sp.]
MTDDQLDTSIGLTGRPPRQIPAPQPLTTHGPA